MAKIDREVIEELKKFTGGSEPDIYLYMVDLPPMMLHVLMAGGLFSALIQKPYFVGVSKNTIHFASTSIWKVGRFTGKHFMITKDEIESAKFRKVGPAEYHTLKLKDGRKLRLVANRIFKRLERQQENMDAFKSFLGK
ncbi:hypothetical protein KKC94_05080 [Patescibacteria group bacterium]|nr:hypothetical protein [Patescibacteria group bacterium]